MPRLIFSKTALDGLQVCQTFLEEKNPKAAIKASHIILDTFKLLKETPHIGRPLTDLPELRELIISFGDSGYISLYRYDKMKDEIIILAFKHQKQAGY